MQLRYAKTHHEIPLEEKVGCGPGLQELSEIWGCPFNISATAETSDFKFGRQLGFAKAHHKITPRKERGDFGLGKLPKILGFPIIFLQRLGLATPNLARCWGLPGTIIKSHAEERVGVVLG